MIKLIFRSFRNHPCPVLTQNTVTRQFAGASLTSHGNRKGETDRRNTKKEGLGAVPAAFKRFRIKFKCIGIRNCHLAICACGPEIQRTGTNAARSLEPAIVNEPGITSRNGWTADEKRCPQGRCEQKNGIRQNTKPRSAMRITENGFFHAKRTTPSNTANGNPYDSPISDIQGADFEMCSSRRQMCSAQSPSQP